ERASVDDGLVRHLGEAGRERRQHHGVHVPRLERQRHDDRGERRHDPDLADAGDRPVLGPAVHLLDERDAEGLAMRLLRRLAREQRGVSMIIAVLLTSVLGLIAVNIFDVVQTENTRSANDAQRQASFAAAEAGIDDYMTKLVSDPTYYYHDVAAGEATRKSTTSGTTIASSSSSPTAWTAGDTSWSYPNGKDNWRTLGNGYQYNLEITPPSSSADYTQILATGEKTGATTNTRIVQVWVRPSVVSDYYRIVDGDVGFGS